MTELNNLPVSRLPEVPREDTLMEGYFGLIGNAATYCARLHEAGVRHSTDVFEAAAETGIPLEELGRLVTDADLMRKPGITTTEARLFTAFGIRSLERLGGQMPRTKVRSCTADTPVREAHLN
ncbi:MAG: DUF4332 domain-containing protein [Clostridia bacterium]|nr:DUF4332 domain-containing protein [Clostridia bacterium]